MKDDFLWVEKYRPKNIEHCILPSDIKNTFKSFVKNGEVPDITDYDNLDTQFNFTEEEVAYLVDNNVIKE